MGWGITFNTNIFISKKDYNKNIYQVKDDIEELDKSISENMSMLKMYSIANIDSIVPAEWKDDSVNWLNNRINEILEEIEISIIERYKLYLYQEYLEEDTNGES